MFINVIRDITLIKRLKAVTLPLHFDRLTCNCNPSHWKRNVPNSAGPTVPAVGHGHGDIPQQADEQQAAGDSSPPLCPL